MMINIMISLIEMGLRQSPCQTLTKRNRHNNGDAEGFLASNEGVLRFQPLAYRTNMLVECVHTHNSDVKLPGCWNLFFPFVHWTAKPTFRRRPHQGPDSTWARSARAALPLSCGTSPLRSTGTTVNPCRGP